jgi:hypothetical protein
LKIGMSGEGGGPDQVEYEQEPSWIYDTYAEELKKNGVQIGQERPIYKPKK